MTGLVAEIRTLHHVRVWHSFGMIKMIQLLLKHGRSLSFWRAFRLLPFLVIGSFNTVVGLLCRLIYSRKIRRVELHPSPVIVLGHWRTGTTYLHELLSCDQQFMSPNGFQCGAPHIFFLTELSFKRLFRFFVPRRRPMDDMAMDLNRPQEEEFAMLGLLGRSIYGSFVFPADGPMDKEYLSLRSLDPKTRDNWLDTWVFFLKAVAFRYPHGRRFLLKTPQHTARIRSILSVFPDAKFVHIVRNPVTVHASTLRLWRSMIQTHGLNHAGTAEHWLSHHVLSTFEEMYECFEQDRNLVPKGNIVEVAYEQLVHDPKAILRKIYEELDLGEFSQIESRFKDRLLEAKNYQTNRHSPVDADDLKAIRSRWRWYIKEYGYEEQLAEYDAATAVNIDRQRAGVMQSPKKSP